jgi:hypothetical protein
MIRLSRMRTWLMTPLLAAALGLSVGLTPTPTFAQNEPPPAEGEEGKGRPLDGYIATSCLVGLALFIVGKSARRQ